MSYIGAMFIVGVFLASGIQADNLPAAEMVALQGFYNSTNGNNWQCDDYPDGVAWNFTTSANPCAEDWQGVTCTTVPIDGYLHVEQINLEECNLVGTVPDSIATLSYMDSLLLSLNYLDGVIPTAISTLDNLVNLDLSQNDYTGPWPVQLFQFAALKSLTLSYNYFSGALPEAFCSMLSLTYFEVTATMLSGTLPDCVGYMKHMQSLMLGQTLLEGTIPNTFGNLLNLHYLEVSEVLHLHGSIPASFANLSNLQSLYLSYNYLTGPIPNATAWAQLEQADLSRNLLTGPIPHGFCDALGLSALDLLANVLNGTVPTCLGNLLLLEALSLGGNQLTGELTLSCVPGSLLEQFDVSSNHLHGNLSRAFAGCTNLVYVSVEYNNFSGTLYGAFTQQSLIEFISAGHNNLTGDLPAHLLQLSVLKVLRLNMNHLTGTVPDLLFSSSLFGFDVSDNALTGHLPAPEDIASSPLLALLVGGNRLSGSIPDVFGYFPLLETFNVTANRLTGSIPAKLANTTSLNFLYMSRNRLTGSLPDNWHSTQRMGYFYADSNYLTGTVPECLGNLQILQSLNLSNNYLTGTLPSTLAQLTELEALLLQDNAFTGTLEHIFNASAQHNLSTVQFSNNQLTGTLPVELFRIHSIEVVAAVSNCFHGSIPEQICNATNLNTLALDGLQSATSCQEGLFAGDLESLAAKGLYIIRNPMTGGVPGCLFQMPKLVTLHLSGNGLSGSLPSDVPISASLTDLSLSHNKLQGSIPSSLLGRKWLNLDLSYNKITHSLSVNETQYFTSETTLSLQQNRLSGDIPAALQGVQNISLLESNLFHCNLQRSDLPTHDEVRAKYQCGSDAFDATLYVWIVVVLCTVSAVAIYMWRYLTQFNEGWRVLRRWWFAGHFVVEGPVDGSKNTTVLPNYMQMCRLVDVIVEMSITCTIYALFVLLPVYLVASTIYGTYSHQYTWGLSAIYTSGRIAFTIQFVFLVLFVGVIASSFAFFARTRADKTRTVSCSSVHDVPSKGTRTWIDATQTSLFYLVYIALNFTIVIGVNVAYVIIFLSQNGPVLTLVQILLAIFKVAYNGACAPLMIRWLSTRMRKNAVKSPKHRLFVQLFVSLVNNILIPCLVVGFISPSCFYDAFKAPEPVTSTYTYLGGCETFNPERNEYVKCVSQRLLTSTTSYNPPFSYSYQCTSSYVSYYSPAYVIMCVIAGFLVPVLQMSVLWLHTRAKAGTWWFTVIHAILPSIFKPTVLNASSRQDSATPRPAAELLVDTNKHITTLLTYLGLVLTFGAVFPPLAVCFTVTLGSIAAFTRLKVGRFLERAREAGVSESSALIEAECVGAGDIAVLQRAVGLLIALNCLFCMLFLFDTLGDATGLHGAFWVLIVMPLLPIAVYALTALYKWRQQAISGIQSCGTEEEPRELEMQASKDEANPLHRNLKMLQGQV